MYRCRKRMTSSVKAEKAAEKVRVLVRRDVVRPRKAHEPTGRGPSTRPATVDTNIASNCHACCDTSGGLGTRNRIARPIPMDIERGSSLTLSLTAGVGRAGAGAAGWLVVWSGGLKGKGTEREAEDEEERRGGRFLRWRRKGGRARRHGRREW
jgi:hypothetical protein